MNMKNIFTLLLLLGAVVSYGQDTPSFDINTYVRPDFVRSNLDLRPSFSSLTAYRQLSTQPTEANLSFGGNASLGQVRNTRKWQSSYFSRLSLTARTSNIGGSLLDVQGSFFADGRYFHKENRFFILSMRTNGELRNTNQGTDTGAWFGEGKMGYGVGRIEYVGDAVHVIRMLHMLREQGLLLKEPSEDELVGLIDLVATYKNQRFFDFRLQLIRETEAILDYMASAGVVEPNDFKTFAHLKDAYDFENAFQSFRAGRTLEFTVGRQARYILDSGWASAGDFLFDVVYNKYSMVNNYTQKRVYGGIDYAYFRGDFFTFIQHRHSIRPYIGYDLTYMPTVRVRLTWQNQLAYDLSLEKEGTVDQGRGKINYFGTALLDYYVSPQFRINGSATLSTANSTHDAQGFGSDSYELSLRGGVLYSIY